MHWRTSGTFHVWIYCNSYKCMVHCSWKCNKGEKKGRKNGLSSVRDEDMVNFVGVGFLRNFLSGTQCLWVLDKHEFAFHSVFCVCRVWGVCADHPKWSLVMLMMSATWRRGWHCLGKKQLLGPMAKKISHVQYWLQNVLNLLHNFFGNSCFSSMCHILPKYVSTGTDCC